MLDLTARRWRAAVRAGTIASIIVAGCAATHVTAAQPSAPLPQTSAQWYANYLEHSRLVRLPNGRSLNLHCIGIGSPTVVLEAGIGGFAFDWRTVQGLMAGTTRVCAYDRAGLGASPAGPHPRDTQAEVADLEALLPAAGEHGPYVLVRARGPFDGRLQCSSIRESAHERRCWYRLG